MYLSPHLQVVLLLSSFAWHIAFISVSFWYCLLRQEVLLVGDCKYRAVTVLGSVPCCLIQNKRCVIEHSLPLDDISLRKRRCEVPAQHPC